MTVAPTRILSHFTMSFGSHSGLLIAVHNSSSGRKPGDEEYSTAQQAKDSRPHLR
jgi:hypothetical protein